MEKLAWSPEMSLGIPMMDDAHKAMIQEMANLMTASDSEFGSSLFSLIAEIERDFCGEEAMMEDINFPALQSHREQHARVLSALHHVVPEVMQGNCASARKVIELLPQWFLFHQATMDAALAVALDLEALQKTQPASLNPHLDVVREQ